VEMNDGKRCGRPIHYGPHSDPTPACLMHSPDPEKSDAAFQEEFEVTLKVGGDGIADFTQFVFPSASYRGREFSAKCVFHDATFMRAADFRSATFTQDADFGGATFTQNAHCGRARFMQGGNFHHAKFAQDADFGEATFTQNAKFLNATFTRDAYFFRAKFMREAHFDEAKFIQDADFRFATFTRYAYFFRAKFMQDADFSRATSTQIVFVGAKFLGPAEFRGTRFRRDQKPFPGPVFSLAEFSRPEAVIFYKTYLGQALFHNCDVSQVNFSSVEWRQRKGTGKRMVFEEEVDLETRNDLSPAQDNGKRMHIELFKEKLDPDDAKDLSPAKDSANKRDYGLIAELYQQLKKTTTNGKTIGRRATFITAKWR